MDPFLSWALGSNEQHTPQWPGAEAGPDSSRQYGQSWGPYRWLTGTWEMGATRSSSLKIAESVLHPPIWLGQDSICKGSQTNCEMC